MSISHTNIVTVLFSVLLENVFSFLSSLSPWHFTESILMSDMNQLTVFFRFVCFFLNLQLTLLTQTWKLNKIIQTNQTLDEQYSLRGRKKGG